MVLSDIMKRWQVLLGKRALLSTGTDEHGMKVGNTEKVESLSTDDFFRFNGLRQKSTRNQRHSVIEGRRYSRYKPVSSVKSIETHLAQSLAERAEISNDYFVRTTDLDHREAVQHFWVGPDSMSTPIC